MTSDAPDLSILFEAAREADHAEQWHEAKARWQAVLDRDPDHMWAHLRLAVIEGELGSYNEAEKRLQAATARWPKDIAPWLSLAQLADRAERWHEAKARWQAVLDRDPDHMWAHLRLGVIEGALGNHDEAEQRFQVATARWPDRIAPWLNLAQLADRAERWHEAKARWQAVLDRDPDHMWAHLRLAVIEGELGNYDEAEKRLQAATTHWPDKRIVWLNYARLASRDKRWDEALTRWRHVLEHSPGFRPAFQEMARCLIELKRYPEAEAVLQEALSHHPDASFFRIQLARVAAMQNNFILALQQIEEVLANPSGINTPFVRQELGYGLIACGQVLRALTHFRGFQASEFGAPPQEPHLDDRGKGHFERNPRLFPKALILDPNLQETVGHHFNLNRFYKQFFDAHDFEVQLIGGYPVMDLGILPEMHMQSYFRTRTFMGTAWASSYESVMHFNAFFQSELEGLPPCSNTDVIVFHSARITIIHGLAQWLKGQFEGKQKIVILGIIEADHLRPEHPHHQIARRVYHQALEILQQSDGLELIVFAETQPVTDFLQSICGPALEVYTIPYLAAHAARDYAVNPWGTSSRLCVGFLGATRSERGPELIPPIIRAAELVDGLSLDWKIQLDVDRLHKIFGTRMVSQTDALKPLESVSLFETGLSVNAYYELFSQVDIVLLPYDVRYEVSGSGVFYEALALGKVQVVPQGSVMVDVLRACGAEPVVFEERTPEAILAALRYAVAHYEDLSQKARAAATAWQQQHSGKAVFERVFLEKCQQIGLDITVSEKPQAPLLLSFHNQTDAERERLLYLFFHIPKTGGKSLRNHFIDHLRWHEEFIHLGPYGIEDAERRGLQPFQKRTYAQRQEASVILGHFVKSTTHRLVPGKEPQYITFLRDPAERLISLYNYTMYREHELRGVPKISFEAWYQHRKTNEVLHWICHHFFGLPHASLSEEEQLDYAQTMLDRFWYVGTLDTFDDDVAYLMQQLGLPQVAHKANVTGIHFERTMALSDDWRAQIYEDHSNDLLLYHTYRDRLRPWATTADADLEVSSS